MGWYSCYESYKAVHSGHCFSIRSPMPGPVMKSAGNVLLCNCSMLFSKQLANLMSFVHSFCLTGKPLLSFTGAHRSSLAANHGQLYRSTAALVRSVEAMHGLEHRKCPRVTSAAVQQKLLLWVLKGLSNDFLRIPKDAIPCGSRALSHTCSVHALLTMLPCPCFLQ